jgi:general stress protein 26
VTDSQTSADQTQAKLLELMRDMYVAMFTTIADDGTLHSVPMARQEVDPSAELWFITARDTDKVRDIATRPQVNLSFSSGDAWVSVHGTATVVDDQARLEELWNTFAEAWFPEGTDDPHLALIRVDVDHAQYWEDKKPKVLQLAEILVSVVRDVPPKSGEQGRIDL